MKNLNVLAAVVAAASLTPVPKIKDETDLERCVRQVRAALAEKPNPNNPGGFVICTLTWHGALDLVAAELTSAELKRVRFRVKA